MIHSIGWHWKYLIILPCILVSLISIGKTHANCDCKKRYRRDLVSLILCLKVCPFIAVDGQWSSWKEWSECTPECPTHSSKRSRLRKCNNPPPSYGGANCQGKNIMEEACNCSVDGKWGNWKEWSSCFPACYTDNHRYRQRSRSCDSPSPIQGGTYCLGNHTDTLPCQNCKKDLCEMEENFILKPNETLSLQISFNKTPDENGDPFLQGCNWTFQNDDNGVLVLYFESIKLSTLDSSRKFYLEDGDNNSSLNGILLEKQFQGKSISSTKQQLKIILRTTESIALNMSARIFKTSPSMMEKQDVVLPKLGDCFPSSLEWTITKIIPQDHRLTLNISFSRMEPGETITIESDLSNLSISPQRYTRDEAYLIPVYGKTVNVTINTNTFIKCRKLDIQSEEEYVIQCINEADKSLYKGFRDVSVTGNKCIPWSTSPFAEFDAFQYSYNFCRQFNSTDTAWCFVNHSGSVVKEDCNVYCDQENDAGKQSKDTNVSSLWRIFVGVIIVGGALFVIELTVIYRKKTQIRASTAIELSDNTGHTNNENTPAQNNAEDESIYCDLPEGVYDTAFGSRMKRS